MSAMTLAEILEALDAAGLWVELEGTDSYVRGGEVTPELRAGLREHRAHVIRLARSDRRAEGRDAGTWRAALRRADAAHREAWALVAHGHEAQGLGAEEAEWLAWATVTGNGGRRSGR